MSATRYSAGVLVFNPKGEILLGHATGQQRWDIPKGRPEDGEVAIDAAVRELFEETSLTVDPAQLQELGRLPYMSSKDLHLFTCRTERTNTQGLQCLSSFPHHVTGEPTLEFCDFGFFTLEQALGRVGKGLAKVLQNHAHLFSASSS